MEEETTNTKDKVRENYLRRKADRLGLRLGKSRKRTWDLNDQGGYCLLEPRTNFLIAGDHCDLTLDNVDEVLEEYKKKWGITE